MQEDIDVLEKDPCGSIKKTKTFEDEVSRLRKENEKLKEDSQSVVDESDRESQSSSRSKGENRK